VTAATTTATPSRSPALWFGVLAGPVLWVTQLYVNYQWEEVLACSPAVTHPGTVLGLGVRTWVLLVDTVTALGTVAALLVALRRYRRTRPVEAGAVAEDHRAGVAQWMALAGVINSVLFLVLIVVGYAPPIILRPCQVPV
jgi:hypothetical protein